MLLRTCSFLHLRKPQTAPLRAGLGLTVLLATVTGLSHGQPNQEGKGAGGRQTAAGAGTDAERQARSDARFWDQIAQRDPPEKMGLRSLFRYLLSLGESRQHPERVERVCELAAQAQDRDPKSRHYGNLKWTWRDPGVTDTNAVEFVSQDAIVVWRKHKDWIPESASARLRDILALCTEGCLRHRVPVSYTNIAILNAANLIVLGETFDRSEVAEEGYRRLDAICLWTWAFGTHEFCSPTYYGVDLAGLEFLRAYARRDRCRRQADALLELYWTDVALNWFAPAAKLGGAHSRSYDYLRGLGHLDTYLQGAGWIEGRGASEGWGHAVPHWLPPARLRQMSGQMPRVVRQAWGMKPSESRTHAIWPDVTLSASSAGYGSQDMLLTVDLPGDRNQARCYFIPDGRNDPYGKVRYETGAAKHLKALHLTPFWAAAQRQSDALGVVIYRKQDLAGNEVQNLQSHFVVRRGADIFAVGGRKIDVPPGTSQSPGRVAIRPGEGLVFRYATAAVGVRVVWSRGQDGEPASVALIDDGLPEALRLTIDHRSESVKTEAGAALWVRVGTSLRTPAAFDAWRQSFEQARPQAMEIEPHRVRVAIPGAEGPVSVTAERPWGQGGEVLLDPEPAQDPIEWNGRPMGRSLLASIQPMAAWQGQRSPIDPVDVPALGAVAWEAEAGLIFCGMASAEDGQACAARYVWQPENTTVPALPGSVVWTLRVAKTGRYFLWARVLAADGKHNSFHVNLVGDGCNLPGTVWNAPIDSGWRWQKVCLEPSKTSTPLELPAGICRLQFRVREPGTKVDRLWLSSDPHAAPK